MNVPHKHESRGNADMKEFQYGNTTVIIHSPLVLMTKEEQQEWYKDQINQGNPILKQIAEAVNDCYLK